jgi:predicted ester cyclase
VRSSAKADSIRKGDRVAFRWLMSGTHKGAFLGLAPTGEDRGDWIDVVGVAEGEIVEHWGEFDVVGMLRQLGVIYAPR